MPANDERDPLDAWLGQQVRPLPPPPGTFELITRRARRRKVRKLAVSVAGAAAVAVAIAVAVPGGLPLTVTQPGISASGIAEPRTPSPSGGGSQSLNGTGRSASASPSASSSTSAAPAVTEPSGPVPDNFQPTSVTFVNANLGWVIGQAGTPGKCANKTNPYICTSVARTDNAGQTWEGGPAPETTGPDANGLVGADGVSQIRFLNGMDGWAYGPGLWSTHDAGNHWYKVDTYGQSVIALETAGDRAFAVFADCPSSSKYFVTGDAVGCNSFTLMSTPAGADNWQAVGPATNAIPVQGNTLAQITLTGSAGYLFLDPRDYSALPTLYSGPLDGAWTQFTFSPPPECAQGGMALAGGRVSVICIPPYGPTYPPGSAPVLWQTHDNGQTWQQSMAAWPSAAPVMPDNKPAWVITSFTAAPNGTLMLATTSGLYVLPSGSKQWKWTSAAGKGAPNGGFSYVGMTTDEQGVAVPADTSLHEIWMTFDGGLTWAPRTPIVPGS